MHKIITDFLEGKVRTLCTNSRIARTPDAKYLSFFDITSCAKTYAEQKQVLNLKGARVKLPFADCAFGIFFHPIDNDVLVVLNDDGDNIQGLVMVDYMDVSPRVVGNFTIQYDKNGIIQKLPNTSDDHWVNYVNVALFGGEDPMALPCPSGYNPVEWDERKKEASTEAKTFIVKAVEFVLFSLLLLNCKNVSYKEIPCSPKLAKRYKERHSTPRPKEYTLLINPLKKSSKSESTSSTSPPKALHLCRGHFKNYDEKPLFGKLKGTYWWPAHARGDASNGLIQKNYEIKM